MARIAVVTDDAAAVPAEWLQALPSPPTVVGMPVMVDDQIFPLDEPDLSRSLLVALAEGRTVTTSRPSPGQFRQVYEGLQAAGYDGIVSVHLSAELSGTVSSARIGRQSIEIPVSVVDTRTVAMDQGYGVLDAVRSAQSGGGMDDVVRAARAGVRNTLLLHVPSLEQLRRGGRLAPSIARIGSVLQIKPILGIKDGKLAVVEMPRTPARAKARFLKLAGEALSGDGQASTGPVHGDETTGTGAPEVVVHHLADPNTAHALGAELVDRYCPEARLTVTEIPPVLAAHVGIGARAVVIRRGAGTAGDGAGGMRQPDREN